MTAFPLVLLGILLVLSGCTDHVGRTMGSASLRHGQGRVTSRCSAPAHLPGAAVHVSLMDMGHRGMMAAHHRMMLRVAPGTVPAGAVSLAATNLGSRRHELVLMPLESWQNFGQRATHSGGKVLERGSLGEASRSCGAGVGEGLRPGTTGWVTLDLAPGHYELLCNEPHHYARGMYAELVVS
jgi:uncharacterized cupredoxin-like copper-binding protein